jgi:hypothetical protein
MVRVTAAKVKKAADRAALLRKMIWTELARSAARACGFGELVMLPFLDCRREHNRSLGHRRL